MGHIALWESPDRFVGEPRCCHLVPDVARGSNMLPNAASPDLPGMPDAPNCGQLLKDAPGSHQMIPNVFCVLKVLVSAPAHYAGSQHTSNVPNRSLLLAHRGLESESTLRHSEGGGCPTASYHFAICVAEIWWMQRHRHHRLLCHETITVSVLFGFFFLFLRFETMWIILIKSDIGNTTCGPLNQQA